MNQMNLQNLQAMLAQAQQPKSNLVEFRAGICTQSGTTVTADKRRGKFVITQGDDGLMHLQWQLRPSGSVEVDLMLLPKGATLERVPECTTGRVYLLQFKASNARRFFWMQEPKEDKDDELCKKVNDLIDNPPPAQGAEGGGQFGGDFDQAQLLSLLGGMGGPGGGGFGSPSNRPNTAPSATTTTSTAAAAPSSASPAPAAAAAAAAAASPAAATGTNTAQLAQQLTAMAQQLQQQQSSPLDLADVLEADGVLAALPEEAKADLLQHLPQGAQTQEELVASLRSPQLRQTLGRMSSILNSAQYGALMASLSLTAGAPGVQPFLDAIAEQAKKDKDEKKE